MAQAGRPTVTIELSDDERETLQRWARRHSSSQALALRCRIVLAVAEGGANTKIADDLGINRGTVAKWRHRFAAERLEVGLYLSPPVAAAVFCVDEKPQIRALNRSAPTLPMLATTPAKATHDYVRNGTVDLFAALEVATGGCATRGSGSTSPRPTARGATWSNGGSQH